MVPKEDSTALTDKSTLFAKSFFSKNQKANRQPLWEADDPLLHCSLYCTLHQNTQGRWTQDRGPPTSVTSSDHVGYKARTVNNSYSLILYAQSEVLLARLGRSHWEEKKKNRAARVPCKQSAAALSCKQSSTESSACTVSHTQCHTDNVRLRFRVGLTCQLCAHHVSLCGRCGLTPAETDDIRGPFCDSGC